jgi:hypothetical protein
MFGWMKKKDVCNECGEDLGYDADDLMDNPMCLDCSRAHGEPGAYDWDDDDDDSDEDDDGAW